MNPSSIIFSSYLSDPELAALFSDESLIRQMLRFESALIHTLEKAGLVKDALSNEIREVLSKINIDPVQLQAGTKENGIPVLPFLELIKKELSGESAELLHFGATSQDTLDCAFILNYREALGIISSRISKLIQNLEKLNADYGSLKCMAHTRGKQAIPTLFEEKIRAWREPLDRQILRLSEFKPRLLKVQLGGAVGRMEVFGEHGNRILKELARELGLQAANSWHNQRDTIAEFSNWIAMTSSILAKMAMDILFMSQDEIGEISENDTGGRSSAMPHKKNPVLSEAIVAMSRMNAMLQATCLQAMTQVNERDASTWMMEWETLPRMLQYCGACLNHALEISEKMKINRERMEESVSLFEERIKKKKIN